MMPTRRSIVTPAFTRVARTYRRSTSSSAPTFLSDKPLPVELHCPLDLEVRKGPPVSARHSCSFEVRHDC